MSDPYDEFVAPPANTELSEREVEILQLLATGLSNKEIASQLYLSVNTVKVHLRNIFAKLGVQSRTEATLVAIQRGYVNVPGATTPASSEAGGTTVPNAEAATDRSGVPQADLEPISVSLPAIEIEPPLPVKQRLALIGIAVIAIGLAFIAVPRGSAQNNGGVGPFSDSAAASDVAAASSSATTWQQISMMSQARGRLAAAALKGQIVAIGGETPGGITGLVEVWDVAGQKWHTGQNKPLPVANVSAAVLDGKVIVPGGYTSAGTPTTAVEAYNPISDTWTSLASLPEPRFAYALAVQDGKAYLFGGWSGHDYANTTYIYDLHSNRWTQGAPLPIGRGFAAAAPLGDAIYVVGGYADGREFDRCDRYLPKEDRWEPCAPMSVGRGGLSLLPIAGQLFAIGGGWTGYLTFNERYDPNSNSWSVVPTPFTGQWRGLGAANIGNDVYALGGWNGQYLNLLEKYNPFPFNIFVPATTK